jgi:hypothetical protein
MLIVRDNELNHRGLTAIEVEALPVVHVIGGNTTSAIISKSMLRQHHSVTALLKDGKQRSDIQEDIIRLIEVSV